MKKAIISCETNLQQVPCWSQGFPLKGWQQRGWSHVSSSIWRLCPAGRHWCPLRLHETGHPLWGYLCSLITYINSFSSASGTDCSPAGLGSNLTRTDTLCLSTLCVAAYLDDFLNQAICQEANKCRGIPLLILFCTFFVCKSKRTHCIDIKRLQLSVNLIATSLQTRSELLHCDIWAREVKKFLMRPQTEDGGSEPLNELWRTTLCVAASVTKKSTLTALTKCINEHV